MKVAIIGRGHVGQALAQGFVRGQHAVRFAARTPTNEALSISEAVAWSEAVVLATPYADSERARQDVIALSNDIGLESVDAGPLLASRYLEPLTLLWLAASRVLETREFFFALARRQA